MKFMSVFTDSMTCLTPASRIWLRNRARVLTGVEYLMLHGVEPAVALRIANALTDSQMRDLAGNSFNGFSVIPLLLGVMTYIPFRWGS